MSLRAIRSSQYYAVVNIHGSAGNAEGGFPPVLDEFMGRLIHMCYSKSWTTKFGGALAMLILGGK